MDWHRRGIIWFGLGVILMFCASPSGAQPLFEWSYNGVIDGKVCVKINEPSEPPRDHWGDNYLCSDEDLGLQWSYAGPIDGMRCTRIREPAEPDRQHWDDNFLCLPWTSPIELSWSHDGPLEGKECVQIREPSDHDYWDDNYLCYVEFPYPAAKPPPDTQGRLLGWPWADYPTSNNPFPVGENANPCVEDVPRTVYDLDSGKRDSALFSFTTAVEGTGDIDRHRHAQGIARLPGVGLENWIVVSKSGDDDSLAGLIFARFPGLASDGGPWADAVPTGIGGFDNGNAEFFVQPGSADHVGGLQMLGQMLVDGWHGGGLVGLGGIPLDGNFAVDFLDISEPSLVGDDSRVLHQFSSDALDSVDYVAATKLDDGSYLLLVATDVRRRYKDHGLRHFRFFKSTTTTIERETKWSDPIVLEIQKKGTEGYQSANMITECRTKEVYLAGMRPWRIRRNYLDLWRLEMTPTGEIDAVLVEVKLMWNTLDGCSFDAGAGVHVTPDHGLVVYCVEKVQDYGVSRPANLDVEEFRDR